MDKFNKTKIIFIFAIAALFLSNFAYAAPAIAKLKGKSVKIGGLYPLAGMGAEWGEFALIGAKLAIDEINDAGGIDGVKIEHIYYDYESKVAPVIPLMTKLAKTDNVLFVNGPCVSTVIEVLGPRMPELKVVSVSYCSAALNLSKPPWLLRNTLTSDRQLEPAVRYWQKTHNVKTAVILYNSADRVSTSEGKAILPVLLKKYDVQVLDFLTFQTGDIAFSAHITKVKALNPDGIALGSCYQEAANIVREARKQGLKQAFVGGACNSTPEFIKLGGKATEGYIGSSTAWFDDPRPKVQQFMKNFLARSGGKKPNYGGFRSYDNIYITKMAMLEQGVTNDPNELQQDRDKIAKGWNKVKDFDGVSGKTTLNELGDGVGEAVTLIAKEGTFQKVENP